MIHTGPVPGDFTSDWKKSVLTCSGCGAANSIRYRIWESSCGGYEDIHYECAACGKKWWVEGSDS